VTTLRRAGEPAEVGGSIENRVPIAAWFAIVVFGRLYTVLICDIPERVFGIDWLCHSWIRDIPSYLWVEIILYGPVVWFALHMVKTDVFREPSGGVTSRRVQRRVELVATTAVTMWLYGVGIHAADIIEVVSRERAQITDGTVYDVAYFLDEGLSHYVQFVSLFLVIGLFVIFDRTGRTEGRRLALLLGVAHGIERGLGIIEGEKWFLAPLVIVWMAAALAVRRRRLGPSAFEEFFFRYAVAFVVALPACQGAYYARFGEFVPPSQLEDGPYAQVAVGAVVLAMLATALLVVAERRWLTPPPGATR
jgi:hypothetical protein